MKKTSLEDQPDKRCNSCGSATNWLSVRGQCTQCTIVAARANEKRIALIISSNAFDTQAVHLNQFYK